MNDKIDSQVTGRPSKDTTSDFKKINRIKKAIRGTITEDDIIAKEIGLKSRAKHKEEVKALEHLDLTYPIPPVYSELDRMDYRNPIARNTLYNVLSRISPYLIQRLLYESQDHLNTGAVRVMAAKVLLDKIIPNVSATDINLSSEDIQSLVIVKTNKTR